MAKSRWVEGTVFEIDLRDGRFAYAQSLNEPLMGFYDGCFSEAQDVEAIAGRLYRFSVWVNLQALKRWRQIGNASVPPNANDQWFFIQDALSKAVELYQHGTGQRRAVDADLIDFEAAAIWFPEQLEERLLDEASGRANRYAAFMLDEARNGLRQPP